MTLFEVIKQVAMKHGYTEQDVIEDGWLEEIAENIVENCGDNLSVEEAFEQVEMYFEEE